MKTLTNIKIFDMNNPNFKIASTKEEVSKKLLHTPVVLHSLGESTNDFGLENVIGYVKRINPDSKKATDGEIYGDITIFDNKLKLQGEFVNYYVTIVEGGVIESVVGVSIK